LVILAVSIQSATQEIVVSPTNTQKCSAAQQRDWDLTTKDTLGVIGHDLIRTSLGSVPVVRIFKKNWWPLQDVKMPICGTLHHFDWHSGDVFTSADEEDWNNFLVPSAAFQQVFQDALPADKSLVWKCDGEYCMEAEITPSSKFYENQWWSKKAKKAALAGKQICAYGPFVEEEWHGKRPEIHPSELYWWRDNDIQSYWLLLQEDASGRFDKEGSYANRKGAPATWKPWALAPRGAEFRLAFTLDESNKAEMYFVNERSSVYAKSLVPPDPIKHTLKFGGGSVEVTEAGGVNKHVKVTFADLCLVDENTLHGYVAITTAVGLEKAPESGGQELLEITSKPVPPAIPFSQSNASLIAGTPNLIDLGGQPREIGDLSPNLSTHGKPLLAEGVAKISLIGGGGELPSENAAKSKIAGHRIAQSVDAIKGAELEVQMQSGEKKQIEIPPLGLALSIKEKAALGPATTGTSTPDSALARAIVGEVHHNLDLRTVQHKEVQLILGIQYAPRESGEVRAEDSSPFSERLNKLLVAKDPIQIKKTLGSQHPFKAAWKFEAWELFADGSSREFLVVPNAVATDGQIGTRWHSHTMNPSLVVEFPTGRGRLFKVVATGTYTDPSGASGNITNEIWNQEILSSLAEVDRLLDSVAAASGLTEEQRKALVGPRKATTNALDYLADPVVRRSNLLRLQAQRASQTGHVSIEEFRDLVSKVKSLGLTSPQ
jgi:hypothetical protein